MAQSIIQETQCLLIGYYPIRGKAQICRLLCQYLHLPYVDLLFTPKTWQEFKATHNLDWTFEELPFLKDGNTIVTQTYPICLYLLHKANRKDLLGNSIMEEVKVDLLIAQTQPAGYILTSFINNRDMTPEVKADAVAKMWAKSLTKKLNQLEQEAGNTFFFGKLTLVDFYIYETFYFLKFVSPQKFYEFPKLIQICQRLANIPQIAAYQQSKKSIKQVCPVKFCIDWRKKCKERSQRVEQE